MITNNLALGTICLDADISIDVGSGYTCYDADKKQLNIMISRGPGDFNLEGIMVGLSSEGNSNSYSILRGESSPIMELDFDDASSGTVYDSSTNENNGDLISATPDSGIIGGAVSYVNIPDNNALDFGINNFSYEHWIKGYPNNLASVYRIISKSWGNGYYSRIISQGTYSALFELTSSPTIEVRGIGVNVLDGQWHHIAFTRGNGEIKLYVDGVIRDTTSEGTVSNLDNSRDLNIGGEPSDGSSVNGTVDEFRIYPYTLNAEEVKRIYNEGKNGNRLSFALLPDKNGAKIYALSEEDVEEVTVAPIIGLGNTQKICEVTNKVKIRPCA